MYQFNLFIAGETLKTQQLVSDLNLVFNACLSGLFTLEVIDVMRYPEIARENEIIATPTLLKKSPLPEKKIFGYPKSNKWLLQNLGLNNSEDNR